MVETLLPIANLMEDSGKPGFLFEFPSNHGPDFQNFLEKSYENLRKILGILKLCTYDEVTINL